MKIWIVALILTFALMLFNIGVVKLGVENAIYTCIKVIVPSLFVYIFMGDRPVILPARRLSGVRKRVCSARLVGGMSGLAAECNIIPADGSASGIRRGTE